MLNYGHKDLEVSICSTSICKHWTFNVKSNIRKQEASSITFLHGPVMTGPSSAFLRFCHAGELPLNQYVLDSLSKLVEECG